MKETANMQTVPECLVCFMQQALATAKASTSDRSVQHRTVNEVGRLLADLDMAASPPVNAMQVYSLIAALTGERDPFAAAKKKSMDIALAFKKTVRRRIETSGNPLRSAIQFAIGSNSIDYGAQHHFNIEETISGCLDRELCIDDFDLFQEEIHRANGPRILYLADNSGEVVFDGLLIEQLVSRGCTVELVVREDVILNDVTMKEVDECGITELCTVVKSGAVCPGTPLDLCRGEIREAFRSSDIIISKGQGNFETLSGEDAPIYFMLTVKCGVVAGDIAARRGLAAEKIEGKGEMILMRQERALC